MEIKWGVSIVSYMFTFSLFFLSFAPLWLSIVFIEIMSMVSGTAYRMTEYICLGCIMIGMIISSIIVWRFLKHQNLENTKNWEVVSAEEEKSVTTEFLLSYILPLFAFDFTKWDSVVLFLIFFFTLAFLCVKHKQFSANVILEIFGFSFYRCSLKDKSGHSIKEIVISRRALVYETGLEMNLKSLNNEYSLDVIRT